MKCQTCEHDFPNSGVKVWNGKAVCASCFETLAAFRKPALAEVERVSTAYKEVREIRLTQVLYEFMLFEPNFQKDLADIAVDWVIACLADSPRCLEVETLFYIMLDIMYSASDHAKTLLSEDEADKLWAEAHDERKKQEQVVYREQGSVMRMAALALAELDNAHPFRGLADILVQLRHTYIEHTDAVQLCKLINDCIAVCEGGKKAKDIRLVDENALDQVDQQMQRILALMQTARRIIDSVCKLIRGGTLVVQDGVVARPAIS